MDFDEAETEMIRRGDMLGPKLGAKLAAALETLQRERDEAWNFDMTIIPQDRKVCVVWKDIYSDGDEGGPKYSVGHTFWNGDHWANRTSSHWEPVAWCDFPPFDPALSPKEAEE